MALCPSWICAEMWHQFRGSSGQGISNAATLPLEWNDATNVTWQTAIHDKGWSSPVILKDRVWLTTASEDGHHLFVLAVDAENGAILLDQELFSVEEPQFAHKFNSYASPTPVLEGDRVYVTFGSPGTACLKASSGKILWQRRDIECNHFRGAGSSPIIHDDLVIMNYDGSDHQFIIALDKMTGETRWQTTRSIDFMDLGPDGEPEAGGDWRKAFSTPHVTIFEEKPVLLSVGSKALYAYEPQTGRELWRTESRIGHSASTRPTVANGMIYYCTGFSKGEIWAVQPGGRGNVTSSHVKWKFRRSVSNKPSLIYHNDHLFVIHDGGVASCIHAKTGKTLWQERIGGNYSASPLLWKDRLYLFSEEGKTSVVRASDTFEILTTNTMGSGFMASPAVIDSALILRSKTHLYRIDSQ